MNKEISSELLSNIIVYDKYAKYIPELERRETFTEIITRYIYMMVDKYPQLEREIVNFGERYLYTKKILPSMRALQFSGKAIELNESRIYNCAYLPVDDYRAFSETMFLLLGGTGVGYSVQFKHVEKLPVIRKPLREQKYLVSDDIQGWAEAVRHLMASFFGIRTTKPRFDFSDIRAKGSRLVTAGGKAPGPEPLKKCLYNVELILDRKEDGEQLTTLECHDIQCHIADAVLAGGIRRAAMISLFSADDEEMIHCKAGNWWETEPQRGRSNNSAVMLRHRIKKSFFMDFFEKMKNSGSGEPGIFFSNNRENGTNPCGEISLLPFQFCNLCEINGGAITTQRELNEAAIAASFFGTLQAGFTDFHYLRNIWKKTTEKEALLGIGMTGIASGGVLPLDLEEAVNFAIDTNKNLADIIGINPAARITTVKPSGTSSIVLSTSSGIHAWHAPYYIRRVQLQKDNPLYGYLMENYPDLIKESETFQDVGIFEAPIKAPDGAITRVDETALTLLERVAKFNEEWITPGHQGGDNPNNVSATINIKDTEWEEVRDWMWKNRNRFNALSVLPHDGGTYKELPFEEISKKEYDKRIKAFVDVDLTKIVEKDDNTTLTAELACAAGNCEIEYELEEVALPIVGEDLRTEFDTSDLDKLIEKLHDGSEIIRTTGEGGDA
jgi:ribonucleoside-triphosphate reductase (thioredoxin)